ERRSGDELLVVEIAGVRAGRTARDAADERVGRNADRSPERRELQRDARREGRRPRARIEAHEAEARVRKIVGERAAAGDEPADAVWVEELEGDDLHLERVARRRA